MTIFPSFLKASVGQATKDCLRERLFTTVLSGWCCTDAGKSRLKIHLAHQGVVARVGTERIKDGIAEDIC